MSTLALYLIGAQLRPLLLTLLALTGLVFSLDIMQNMRRMLEQNATTGQMLQYFLLSLPENIVEITPFALLIATVVGLGGLSGRSEITAMRAAGISVLKLVVPMLGVGLAVSVLLVWVSLSAVPHAAAMSERIMAHLLYPEDGGDALFTYDRVWLRNGPNTFYGIRTADPSAGTLWGIRIIERNDRGGVATLTTAERMVWEDDAWHLENAQIFRETPAGPTLTHHDRAPTPFARAPAALGEVGLQPEALGHSRLKRYIRRLKADGHDASPYQMEMARRLAFPFTALIMVLVAIPHGLSRPRTHTTAKGVGTCLIIALCYWILYSLALALGRADLLSATWAAWLPVAVFAAYGTHRLLSIPE